MQPISKIVIIGAIGMLGKPVTQELLTAGFQVTIVARDIEKAKLLFPAASVIEGDLHNKSSLIKAFTGQEAVYCNLNIPQSAKPHVWLPEREGLNNLLEAAHQTGIRCISLISSVVMNYQGMNGFHWWVFDIKQQAVRKIKQSGIPYLVFYPSTFMDNFLYTYRRGNNILLAGTSHAPMYYIAAEDYGKQVASALKNYHGASKEYVVQGLEPYTADQAAKVFISNYTKANLRVLKAPLGLLKILGNFSLQINYGVHIVEALNNYPEKFTAKVTWEELGRPTVTLKEFAQKHSY